MSLGAAILNGRQYAEEVRAQVATRVEQFAQRYQRPPGLHVVLVGDDAASQVYVGNKERTSNRLGMAGHVHRLSAATSEAELVALIGQLNLNDEVDGILIQLPLPKHLNASRVIRALDPDKDVDGLHPSNQGRLLSSDEGLRPCTPAGCLWMLKKAGVTLAGAQALVVGRSNLVGKPVALMLLEEHATVTVAHSKTRNLQSLVKQADVVVAAVGRPKMLPGAWFKQGCAILDVGINRLSDGSLIGDVDFDEARKRAAWITPVPGGVGAMTVAMLMHNTLTAAERRAVRPS